MIFKPRLGRAGGDSRLEDLLVYLQPFKAAQGTVVYPGRGQARTQVTEDNIEMFRVTRKTLPNGSRPGIVVKLTDIWRYIELVPKFGKACNVEWNAQNTYELATEFYINSFADREIYQSVY